MRQPRVAIIEGEEELGPQRRCSSCGDWWPNDTEFFYAKRYSAGSVAISRLVEYVRGTSGTHVYGMCRACWQERSAALYAARKAAARKAMGAVA